MDGYERIGRIERAGEIWRRGGQGDTLWQRWDGACTAKRRRSGGATQRVDIPSTDPDL